MTQFPILIISLSDAQERREHLTSMLEAAGLPFAIFDAIDARSEIPAGFESYVDQPGSVDVLGREMSTAEVGCALSHMMLYKHIVDEGLPGAIIFEDDAILAEGDMFIEFWHNRIYERGDLYQLSYGAARVWRFGFGERRESRRLRSRRLVHNAGLTTAYSISRRGASYLLDCGIPIRCVADWPCDLGPISPRVLIPKLVGRPPEKYRSHLTAGRSASKSSSQVNARRRLWGTSRTRNPRPVGFKWFHRFFSKTIF